MGQLEDWFRSWVPESVYSAGGGRSSVEAWYTPALDIGEVLSGVIVLTYIFFVADVIKSFDTVDRAILDMVLSSLVLPAGCLAGSAVLISYTILTLGYGLSLLLALRSLGLVMGASHRGAL